MRQVLVLLASGYTNKEIEVVAGMKRYTVEKYRNRLIKHLGARTSCHMIAKAYQNKILNP